MKFRIRQEDTYFYLREKKRGDFELFLHGGRNLSALVVVPHAAIVRLRELVQDATKGNIHHRQRFLTHTITISTNPGINIQLSRYMVILGGHYLEEVYSTTLYSDEILSFVNWLRDNGF